MLNKFTILFPLVASGLAAQISAPSLGLVYDAQNQALRRISGMPGAATIGDPVLTGIVSAAIAPDHSFAIVNDGEYKLYSAAGLRILAADLGNGSRIAFSPTGETAAFYANGTFTVVTGLPSHPVSQTVTVEGAVGQFAVNANGLLLISIARDTGEGLVSVSAQGQRSYLADVTQTSAIIFSKDGAKAWVADAAENRIWAISTDDTAPIAVRIAAAADGLDAPLALALSPDSQRLFIANGGSANIIAFDLTRNTAISSTPCACMPATLVPLASTSVFRLTELSSGPMWILDASQPGMQTLFVPAVNQ